MFQDFQTRLTPPIMERVTLLANHVLSREAAAMRRLAPHAGAVLQVLAEPWPAMLPQPPAVAFKITPAGLLEWCENAQAHTPNLRVVIDGSNPLSMAVQWAAGKPPSAHVEGDSRLAGDVDWLIANLRWDLIDDLEATFGPQVAQTLGIAGETLRAAFEAARMGVGELAGRFGKPAP